MDDEPRAPHANRVMRTLERLRSRRSHHPPLRDHRACVALATSSPAIAHRSATHARTGQKNGSSRNPGERGADLEEEVLLVAVPVSS
ncbi:hypothetical protein, partial [Burkholderia thailandensis]|uniref:hypothetical protein n=1 Tax=Burkholderia thailandensis TaxID=57975 RepID=UPI001E538953